MNTLFSSWTSRPPRRPAAPCIVAPTVKLTFPRHHMDLAPSALSRGILPFFFFVLHVGQGFCYLWRASVGGGDMVLSRFRFTSAIRELVAAPAFGSPGSDTPSQCRWRRGEPCLRRYHDVRLTEGDSGR